MVPIHRREIFPPIVMVMIFAHLNWGILLITNYDQVRIISSLIGINRLFSDLNLPHTVVGATLIFASLLSSIGLFIDYKKGYPGLLGFCFLFPQFMINVGAAISDSYSVVVGKLEGRDLNRAQLEAALCITIIVAVMHTFLVIQRYTTWKVSSFLRRH